VAHGQWTEVEARGVIAAWRKSGMSTTDFARERGIVPQRIYWWRKKLEDDNSKGALKLLPIHVTEPKRGEPVTVLLRSGHMLKLGRGFDEDAFVRVVALLEAS
jgi:transposase-like protein